MTILTANGIRVEATNKGFNVFMKDVLQLNINTSATIEQVFTRINDSTMSLADGRTSTLVKVMKLVKSTLELNSPLVA